MRLLPVRSDHAGGGIAGEEQETDAQADHRAHGRQHLSLRHLSAHRSRYRARRSGGLSHGQANHQASVATTVSRRGFVEGAAGLMFAFTLGGLGRVADALGATQVARINAWVAIGTDDTVTILCPSAEMGQGVMTSLPLILAEELDADWSKVKTEFAPANPKVYGNPHELFKGAQITAASVSVPGYFTPLRVAGAQA